MKKFLSFFLSIGLVIGMVPMNVMAQNGPCQDEYPPAYIEFLTVRMELIFILLFLRIRLEKLKV